MFPFFAKENNFDAEDDESRPKSHVTVQLSQSDQSLTDDASVSSGSRFSPTMPTTPEFIFRRSDLPMLNLETDRGDIFKAWKTRWSDYLTLSNLCHQEESTKVRVLRSCMTPESLVILQNLGVPEDPTVTTVETVIKKIEEYADQSINVNLGWHKLTSRTQQEGETITDFVMSLRQLIKDCDTCNDGCRDRAVRVQLIRGVQNQAITEALLKIRKITLEEAVETAMSMEQAKIGGESLHKEPTVNRLSSYQQSKKQYFQNNVQPIDDRQNPRTTSMSACPTCGGRPHTRNGCPAANATCDHCQKVGHFRRVCPLRTQPQFGLRAQSGGQQTSGGPPRMYLSHRQMNQALPSRFARSQPSNRFLGTENQRQQLWHSRNQVNQLSTFDSGYDTQDPEQQDFFSAWANEMEEDEFAQSLRCIRACLNGRSPSRNARILCDLFGRRFSVIVLPDSGADVTAVSPAFLQLMGADLSSINPHPKSDPTGADGSPLACVGSIQLSWQNKDRRVQDTALVIPGVATPLLKWSVSRDLDLISFNYQPVPDLPLPAQVQPIRKVQLDVLSDSSILEFKQKLLIDFSDVFSDRVTPMRGEEFRINLTSDAVPFCVSAPRTVAFAFKEPLRRELKALQDQDIIEPVTYPTAWCSPIVVEPKKDGVRLCVDFTKLNQFVKREYYYKDPPATLVADIPFQEAKYFTSLDAKKGYHQCPLAEASRDLTTFITPFGRFRYKRAPFGISSISDHYNHRMDESLKLEHANTRRQVDDLLAFDRTLPRHFEHVRDILLQCRRAGITLSKEKFHFAEKEVIFAGYKINEEGYSIDPKVTEAIRNFPQPKSVTDLRSFFGLVNQLTGTRFDLSETLEPLRSLLSTKNDFIWTAQHSEAFERAVSRLSCAPMVSFFDLSRQTRILSDASRVGLGFVLQQFDPSSGHWSTVQADSRFLSPTEKRYAAIELELLAICYVFRKCTQFIQGTQTAVLTDHKPLIPIINSKRLDEIENPRLRRMRYYLAQFQIQAQHIDGKKNFAADALSRAPHDQPPKVEVRAAIAALHYASSATENSLRLRILQMADQTYQDLRSIIISDGFPHHKHQLDEDLRQFWNQRNELTVQDDLIICGERILIPRPLQIEMLRRLHLAHQGVRQTQNFARQYLYWPSMSTDIENFVNSCQQCARFARTNPKQPLQQPDLPTFPFQEVAIDFFQLAGKHFLALADAFSNWPELHVFQRAPSSAMLIAAIAPIFARFGAPQILRCDNGSQFTSSLFRQFLQRLGTRLVTSAPYYPQSNGRAENMVKILKSIVKKSCQNQTISQDIIANALWAFRNTPSSTDGLSPAVKLLGRATRGPIPMHQDKLRSPRNLDVLMRSSREKRELHQQKAKAYYDVHSHILNPVHVGAHVAVRNPRTNEFDKNGVVTKSQGRRITVKFQDGSTSERDRRDIKPRRVLPAVASTVGSAQTLDRDRAEDKIVVKHSDGLARPDILPGQILRRSKRDRRPPNRLQF